MFMILRPMGFISCNNHSNPPDTFHAIFTENALLAFQAHKEGERVFSIPENFEIENFEANFEYDHIGDDEDEE